VAAAALALAVAMIESAVFALLVTAIGLAVLMTPRGEPTGFATVALTSVARAADPEESPAANGHARTLQEDDVRTCWPIERPFQLSDARSTE
jgi:hypothetical protein